MSIPARDLWKTRFLNGLNANCSSAGYSHTGRPLIKGQWQTKLWLAYDLDEDAMQYCCVKINPSTEEERGPDREERELCMNCASWLEKYYRELDTRNAEQHVTDALVPLLEQIIENQQKQLSKLDDILVAVRRPGITQIVPTTEFYI